MPENHTKSDDKGYNTMEYANQDGGQVGSLSPDELDEVLDTVRSGDMAEQIQRSYERQQE